MDEGPSLRLLCGDELGYVRTVQAATAQRLSAASVVSRWGDGRRANGVSRLALSDGGEEAECCLLAGAAAGKPPPTAPRSPRTSQSRASAAR